MKPLMPLLGDEFNKKIPEGTRFSLQDSELNYIVMSESPKWGWGQCTVILLFDDV